MHVGMCITFQNPSTHTGDHDVHRNEVRLADKCYDTIIRNIERIGAGACVGIFRFAGMPWTEAGRNLSCVASAVMPRLQARSSTGKIAWAA